VKAKNAAGQNGKTPNTTLQFSQDQRLVIGDSRTLPEIETASVDFIMTSPPYWNLKDYGGDDRSIGSSDYAQYIDDLNAVWAECYRVARDGAVMVINVNSRRHKKQFFPIAFDIVNAMRDWRFHDMNVWYIPNALPQPNHYMERLLDNKMEYLLVFVKGDADSYTFHKPRVPQKYATADPRPEKKNARGRCLGNILRIPAYRPPNIKKMNYHVAAFPEELVAYFLECYTDENDVVFDPFVGSGTTLKVCNVMRRRGIGCELNDAFVPLIRERIQEYWEVPEWTDLDIIHSSTSKTGSAKPRKVQFAKGRNGSATGPVTPPEA